MPSQRSSNIDSGDGSAGMLSCIEDGMGTWKLGMSGIESCCAYTAANLDEERSVGADSRGRRDDVALGRSAVIAADIVVNEGRVATET